MRVTKVDGSSRTKHWVLGAVIAVLCSFAYAKAPGMPHFGSGGGGYAHVAVNHAMPGGMRGGGRYYGASAARPAPARHFTAERGAELPHGGANFARGSGNGNGNGGGFGFGGYNAGMRHVEGPTGYPGQGRGGMQYAGAITPVSAESRAVPRPPANAPVRTGSIRADVARYNEERGSARGMQRPNDDPRQSEGSPYRN